MTREEIISSLLYMKRSVKEDTIEDRTIDEAIKALEQEPCDTLKLDGMLEDAYEHGYEQARHDFEVQPCEDAISRKSIKRKLQEHHDFFVNAYGGFSNLPQNDKSRVDEITNCIAMVVNEPPVTPKPTECEDAVSAVMHILTELGYGDEENGADVEYMSALCDVAEKVKALPPVTPKQRTGKWIIDGHHRRCSICENSFCVKDREGDMIAEYYCPNCGAKMEGERANE